MLVLPELSASRVGAGAAPRPVPAPPPPHVISVLGDLDASSARSFEAQVVETAAGNGGDLVLDLSRTRTLSDAGFDAVVNLMRAPHRSPRHLLLVIGHGSTARAMTASAAAHGFSTYPTLADAEAASIARAARAGTAHAREDSAAYPARVVKDGLRPAWQEPDELLVLTHDPRPALKRLAELACSSMDAVDGASVILGSPAAPDLLAASSAWTQHLDGLQLTAAEGPTLDAYRLRRPVLRTGLPHDRNRPALRDQVASSDTHGSGRSGSCAAVPIRLRPRERPEDVVGVLTVYSCLPDRLGSAPTQHLLRRLASRAAGIVATARRIREVVDTQEHLQRALTSRAAIDRATGMLMRDRDRSADEALTFLRRAGDETRRTVSEVAHAMVSGGDSDDE